MKAYFWFLGCVCTAEMGTGGVAAFVLSGAPSSQSLWVPPDISLLPRRQTTVAWNLRRRPLELPRSGELFLGNITDPAVGPARNDDSRPPACIIV